MDTKHPILYKLLSFLGLLCLFSSSAEACIKPASCCPPKPCCCRVATHQWYLDTNVGRSYDYAHNNTTFLANQDPPSYGQLTNVGGSPSANFFSIGGGYVWGRTTNYFPFLSAGLQYRYTVPTVIATNIADLAQPQYQGTGSYKLGQQSYMVQGKADIYRWDYVMPYVSLGLGASLNRVSQFVIREASFQGIVGAPAKTTTEFAYSIGAGLDFPIKKDFWATLGYSYDYFGRSKETATLQPQTVPPVPPINISNHHIHAQTIQLGVRYLFA